MVRHGGVMIEALRWKEGGGLSSRLVFDIFGHFMISIGVLA